MCEIIICKLLLGDLTLTVEVAPHFQVAAGGFLYSLPSLNPICCYPSYTLARLIINDNFLTLQFILEFNICQNANGHRHHIEHEEEEHGAPVTFRLPGEALYRGDVSVGDES